MHIARVVSHKTSDSSSVLFQCEFGGRRYLFGRVCEGLQRVMVAEGIKMAKIEHLFLSGSTDWVSQMGGLGGMILTLGDQGVQTFNIHGDRNIGWGLASLRHTLFRDQFNLRATYMNEDFVDDSLAVVPVELGGSETAMSDLEQVRQAEQIVESTLQTMFPTTKVVTGNFDEIAYASQKFGINYQINPPDMRPKKSSMSYIIQPHPFRGKFNNQKAEDLGIPRNDSRKRLVDGEPYVFPDGRVVTREMVLEDDVLCRRFIFLDLETKESFEAAKKVNWFAPAPTQTQYDEGMRSDVRSFELKEDQTRPEVAVVIHHLHQSIDPFSTEYQDFMKQFGPHCEHLLSHPDYVPDSLTNTRAAQHNVALRLTAPKHFKELHTAPALRAIPSAYLGLEDGPERSEPRILPFVTGIAYRIKADSEESTSARVAQEALTRHEVITKMQDDLRADILERAPQISAKIEHAQRLYRAYEKKRDAQGRKTATGRDSSENSASSSEDDGPATPGSSNSEYDQVSFVTVGTGSALPGVYRNVIGTIVRFPFYKEGTPQSLSSNLNDTKAILLDCGESTYFNLARMYGPGENGVESRLRQIKMVYISHMHADHLLGLISFLHAHNHAARNARARNLLHRDELELENNDKLYIICPAQVQAWLREWEVLSPALLGSLEMIDIRFFLRPSESPVYSDQYSKAYSGLKNAMRIAKIDVVPAIHCANAFSVAIEFANGFKLAYSGDTRPNVKFVDIGLNSTLLIHEATLNDDLIQDAVKKRHATVSEAIAMAQHMNAKNLLLTHFSQRYPTAPRLNLNGGESRGSAARYIREDAHGSFLKREPIWGGQSIATAIAYDGMTMKIRDIGLQYSWHDVLKFVYATIFSEDNPADPLFLGGKAAEDDELTTWLDELREGVKSNTKRQSMEKKNIPPETPKRRRRRGYVT